nr:hypothetical protein [Tanacetum cinerariifolium]
KRRMHPPREKENKRRTTEEELDWYGEILINGTYKLDGADVDAEEYKGDDHHKDTLSKGIFKLTIIRMCNRKRRCTSYPDLYFKIWDVQILTSCGLFGQCVRNIGYQKNVDIHKKNDDVPSGLVYLRFMTEVGGTSAMNLIKKKFHWDLKVKP